MFFSSKKKPEETPTAPVTAEPEAAPQPEEVKAPEPAKPMRRTTIGKGITFYGNFETEDPMEINGTVMGDITSSALVSITGSASLKGDATMKDLSSEGRIEGNIVVDERSSFSPTAVTDGTLTTRYLSTEPGCAFLGQLSLSGDRANAAPAAEAKSEAAESFKSAEAEAPAAEAETEEFSWSTDKGEEEE